MHCNSEYFAVPAPDFVFKKAKGHLGGQYEYGEPYVRAKSVVDFKNHNSKGKPIAHIVLSGSVTKQYVEHIFNKQVDHYYFQKRPIAMSNVIVTEYRYGKTDGAKGNYMRAYQARIRIFKTIKSFINKHRNDYMIIAGRKKDYEILRSTLNPKGADFQDAFDTITSHRIVPYDVYKTNQKEYANDKGVIPFIHFGITGTNMFAHYRAMLIISPYYTNKIDLPLYCNCTNRINLNELEWAYNKNIVSSRQLEGRLLRFTDAVQVKYLYRMHSAESRLAGNEYGFISDQDTLHLPATFIFKQQSSFRKYCEHEYTYYRELPRAMKADFTPINNIFSHKEKAYIAYKYTIFYYSMKEKGYSDHDIHHELKSRFFPLYFSMNSRCFLDNIQDVIKIAAIP